MSLINQMLQDLDARKVAHGSGSGLPNDVRPLPRSAPSRLPYVIGSIALLLVLAVFAAFYSGVLSGKVEIPLTVSTPMPEVAPPSEPVAASAPLLDVTVEPPAAPASEPLPVQPTVANGDLQALDVSLRMANYLELAEEKKSEPKPAPANKSVTPNKPAGKPEKGNLAQPEGGRSVPQNTDVPVSPPLIEKTDAPGTSRERADAEYRRAIALVNQGRIDDALAGLRNALRVDALHQTARQLLVKLLLEAKRTEEAEQTLSEGVQRQPAQLAWAMTLARLQVDRGDLSGAWQTLNYSQPAAAGNADYQGFSGHVLQRLARHKEAIEHYLAAARLAPDDGRWWLGLGLSLESDGRTGEAREAFEHARKGGNLNAELMALIEQKLK